MRITKATVAYLILAIAFAITPTILFALLYRSGAIMRAYMVTGIDLLIVFAFTFVPLVLGFIGGQMYINDLEESDPLGDPDMAMRKNKGH